MIRKLAAVAACLGGLAASGLAAAPAFASGPAPVYSKDVAGWQDARWTRYLTGTVTLPSNAACKTMATVSPQGFGAALTLGPAEESNAGVADPPDASTVGISMVPDAATGCGLISPSFASNLPGYGPANQFPADAITLRPGDSVSMNLFYSQTLHVTKALVRDNTTGDSAQAQLSGAATYQSSSVSEGFGAFVSPAAKSRLWLFTGLRMTTYTGHNNALGHFAPARVIMTTTGTAAGHVEASSPFLWAGGENAGLWIS